MQRRFRTTRLVSATIFVVLGVALLAAGVLVEGLLVLALGLLLYLRVFLVREGTGVGRKGGTLPPPEDEGEDEG